MSVVDFEEKKLERSPHAAGEAVCLDCRHTWVAVSSLYSETSGQDV